MTVLIVLQPLEKSRLCLLDGPIEPRVRAHAKQDHRLRRGRLFELSFHIRTLLGGKTHKRQGAVPVFVLLRGSVRRRSKPHTILGISRANPFVTAPRHSRLVVPWQYMSLWPIQIVVIRMLSKLFQTSVVVMADVNVGLAQLFSDFCERATLIEMQP